MFEEITKVKVTCDECGYTTCVGDDPDHDCFPFDTNGADTAEEAAIQTLDKQGWSYDYPDEMMYCPVCTHGLQDD